MNLTICYSAFLVMGDSRVVPSDQAAAFGETFSAAAKLQRIPTTFGKSLSHYRRFMRGGSPEPSGNFFGSSRDFPTKPLSNLSGFPTKQWVLQGRSNP